MSDIERTEQDIKHLIKMVGSNKFFIALHNAYSHGEAMKNADEFFTDQELSDLFENFNSLVAISKNIS